MSDTKPDPDPDMVQEGHMPPVEIVDAAIMLAAYFKEKDVEHWRLCGCRSDNDDSTDPSLERAVQVVRNYLAENEDEDEEFYRKLGVVSSEMHDSYKEWMEKAFGEQRFDNDILRLRINKSAAAAALDVFDKLRAKDAAGR